MTQPLQAVPSFPPFCGTSKPSIPPLRRLQHIAGLPLLWRSHYRRPAEPGHHPALAPSVPWAPPSCTRRQQHPGRASDLEPPGPNLLPSLFPRIRQHRFCSKTFGDFWSGVAILAQDCPRGPREAAGRSPPAPSPARSGGPTVPRHPRPPRALRAPGVFNRLRARGHHWRQGRHFNRTRRNRGPFPQCPAFSGRLRPLVRCPKSSPRIRRAFPRLPPTVWESSGTKRLSRSTQVLYGAHTSKRQRVRTTQTLRRLQTSPRVRRLLTCCDSAWCPVAPFVVHLFFLRSLVHVTLCGRNLLKRIQGFYDFNICLSTNTCYMT